MTTLIKQYKYVLILKVYHYALHTSIDLDKSVIVRKITCYLNFTAICL